MCKKVNLGRHTKGESTLFSRKFRVLHPSKISVNLRPCALLTDIWQSQGRRSITKVEGAHKLRGTLAGFLEAKITLLSRDKILDKTIKPFA